LTETVNSSLKKKLELNGISLEEDIVGSGFEDEHHQQQLEEKKKELSNEVLSLQGKLKRTENQLAAMRKSMQKRCGTKSIYDNFIEKRS